MKTTPRVPSTPRIEPGISPRTAGAFCDRLWTKFQDLSLIASEIHAAYDAELHRIYGYDFCRPLPGGGDSAVALQQARARWAAAVSGFTLPDVDEIDEEFRLRDEEQSRRILATDPPFDGGGAK